MKNLCIVCDLSEISKMEMYSISEVSGLASFPGEAWE